MLLWVSTAQAEVLVQPDFDAQKFSGLWHIVAMVSDCKVFLSKKDHLLMSISTINATGEGNLSVHMEFPRMTSCARPGQKVGSEGHFRVPALGYLDVHMAEMDYSSFALVYIYSELVGALSTMVRLQ
ncbi:lipocalin-15 [Castor canadensis]